MEMEWKIDDNCIAFRWASSRGSGILLTHCIQEAFKMDLNLIIHATHMNQIKWPSRKESVLCLVLFLCGEKKLEMTSIKCCSYDCYPRASSAATY